MKSFNKFLFIGSIIISVLFFSDLYAIKMENYCYVPPIIGQAVRPNVLFVIDVSGSMSWRAYSGSYNSSKTYEGYFDPDKYYHKNNGVYTSVDTLPSGVNCQNDQCCDGTWLLGVCFGTLYSKGNYLNWYYMKRIDLVRWAITGGKPESCNSRDPDFCDPFLYPNSQLSCDDEGCILETYNGELVKVPWDRLKQSLVYQFKQMSLKPRLGVMFFSGSGVRFHKVYIGDYINSSVTDNENPYKNLITAINYEDPTGATPTGPALWDAYNYFSQVEPEYGGFEPQSGEDDKWKNPMYQCFDENNDGVCENSEFKLVPCAKNFIILLTDGQWNTPSCSIRAGFEENSADPVVPAYWLHRKGFTNNKTGEKSCVDAIYGIGLWLGGTGEQSLKNVAMYGSFDYSDNKTWPDSLSGYPWDTCYMDDCGNGRGSACTSLPPSSSDWDKDGDGVPDTFYNAQNAQQIRDSIHNAILDILRRSTSGATVATLTGKRGYSSLLIQPYLYPRYQPESEGQELSWLGLLKSFWVDFDSNLREDNVEHFWLNVGGIENDTIFQFVSSDKGVKVWEFSDFKACEASGTELRNWESEPVVEFGCKLADTSASDRKIYANYNGNLTEITDENFRNWLFSLWKGIDSSLNDTVCYCILKYIIGDDTSSCNSDWVKRPHSLDISEVCNPSYYSGKHIWKVGDIIFSTPSIASNQAPGIYHLRYHDMTYLNYISSDNYRKRKSYIFVGANDGMLHVFQLGYTVLTGDKDRPVKLIDDKETNSTAHLGKEEWAFVPKSVLPYLVWYGHKDYCHIPYVDYRTMIIDASINGAPDAEKNSSSWRTLLIGVTGFGGKAITVNGTTYSSSIFVIDLTDWLNDPENKEPQLLWEKSLPDHTLTLSFPSIIRKGDMDKNGEWYLVIGSGPKDPGGTQFSNATIYFFDLRNGNKVAELSIKNGGANIQAAVGDTMPVDVDNDYQDDVIYFGTYTQNSGSFYKLPLKDSSGGYKDISSLTSSDISLVINPDVPVFAAPTFTKDKEGHFWVFLGTGRFLNDNDREPTYRNYLIGLKDDYLNATSYNFPSDLDNQTGNNAVIWVTKTEEICMCDWNGCEKKNIITDGVYNGTSPEPPVRGWFQELDSAELIYSQPFILGDNLETMIYKTSNDICKITGESYVMALCYNTGVPCQKPSVLGIEGTVKTNVTIPKKYFVGKGAPSLGQPFQVGNVNPATGRYQKFTQISSGVVVQLNQQMQGGARGKFLLWIEK